MCVLSDESVIDIITAKCDSEHVTSDDDNRGMEYYTRCCACFTSYLLLQMAG